MPNMTRDDTRKHAAYVNAFLIPQRTHETTQMALKRKAPIATSIPDEIEDEREEVTALADRMAPPTDDAGLIKPAKRPDEIADELAGVEFVKKPELCALGSFNVIGARIRMAPPFGNQPAQEQVTFTVQLLDGENRGATCACSFALNDPRQKLADAVKRHGAVGPYRLESGKNAQGLLTYFFNSATDSKTQGKLPF